MKPAIMKVVISLVLFAVEAILAIPVALNGNEFLSLDLKSIQTDLRQSIVQLRFRTIHPNGLLVYSQGTSAQFFRLEIVQGRVR